MQCGSGLTCSFWDDVGLIIPISVSQCLDFTHLGLLDAMWEVV